MTAQTLTNEQHEEIRSLLLGHKIVKVDEDVLLLDDGTRLRVNGHVGCGGCMNGHYNITELNDCPVNAIMTVEFDEPGYEDDGLERFRIFVLAENQRIKLLEVEGQDNGWYGSGYWIEVLK